MRIFVSVLENSPATQQKIAHCSKIAKFNAKKGMLNCTHKFNFIFNTLAKLKDALKVPFKLLVLILKISLDLTTPPTIVLLCLVEYVFFFWFINKQLWAKERCN